MTEISRMAAFADGDGGGNPAGVVIADAHPPASDMQRIAAEVGYSETAFAMPQDGAWRVRYFAPAAEVSFCGHATIALGAKLALDYGDGVFDLLLNDAAITVEGRAQADRPWAALQSPPTRSAPITPALEGEVLALFGYAAGDVDRALPPARIHAGADHLAFLLNSRAALAALAYELDAGRELMLREGLTTILFGYAETPRSFHTRNPFAAGGVYEDPATGAATAALGGYLRDLGWPHGGAIDVIQGEDMGMRSRLRAEIGPDPGDSIRVSGAVRFIEE